MLVYSISRSTGLFPLGCRVSLVVVEISPLQAAACEVAASTFGTVLQPFLYRFVSSFYDFYFWITITEFLERKIFCDWLPTKEEPRGQTRNHGLPLLPRLGYVGMSDQNPTRPQVASISFSQPQDLLPMPGNLICDQIRRLWSPWPNKSPAFQWTQLNLSKRHWSPVTLGASAAHRHFL